MRAALLRAFGSPISVERIDEPEIGTGEVIVSVVAAPVLRYMREVVSGARHYVLELPAVPGASAIG
jgi:alcohol dehydrogenase